MTTTDYLINGLFVLVVLRQSRERVLDRRSVIVPLVLVFFVAQKYLHSIPTAGNDLVLFVLFAAAGVALGLLRGSLPTFVPAPTVLRLRGSAGPPAAADRGIGSRMAFAFAIGHGAEPAIRSFSIAHQIGAAAWPVALVSMALCEVRPGSRCQLRGRRLVAA